MAATSKWHDITVPRRNPLRYVAVYFRIMIDPSLDYVNELFLERTSSIIYHASDFSSIVNLNREVPLYRKHQVLPQHLKFEKGGIRSAGNTSLGPVDLHFSQLHVCQWAGRKRGMGDRYSDIFHFVSNGGIAIKEVAVAAFPGKQVVAVRDRAFARARG